MHIEKIVYPHLGIVDEVEVADDEGESDEKTFSETNLTLGE